MFNWFFRMCKNKNFSFSSESDISTHGEAGKCFYQLPPYILNILFNCYLVINTSFCKCFIFFYVYCQPKASHMLEATDLSRQHSWCACVRVAWHMAAWLVLTMYYTWAPPPPIPIDWVYTALLYSTKQAINQYISLATQ